MRDKRPECIDSYRRFIHRRMAETAAVLADEVLPDQPLRQWVLSLPHALRFLLASNSEALTLVLGGVWWAALDRTGV